MDVVSRAEAAQSLMSAYESQVPVEPLTEKYAEVAGTGAGGAVLGSPLNSLIWLANTLGERGVALRAGHVVLPGSITASVPVSPGDVFTATFTGLGSVTAVFAPEEVS